MIDVTALGKLNTSLARFLQKYPLLGGLLATWTTVEDASVNTMGVGMGQGGIILLYAPAFVRRITVEGLIAVLHHEVRHVVFGHVFLNQNDFPDQDALVVAEEVSVNENLPEKLPIRGILLKDYSELRPNQDTLTRYYILANGQANHQMNRNGLPSDRRSADKSSGSGIGKVAATGTHPQSTKNSNHADSNPAGASQNTSTIGGTCPGAGKRAGTGKKAGIGNQPDNHDRWASIKKDESFARATIESTLRELIKQGVRPTEYEQKVFEETIKDCGPNAGNRLSVIGESERRTKGWRSILRRYVGKVRQSVSCYQRPARRFPNLLGIVPGRYTTAGKPRVMAGIDTSASMSDADLTEISKELLVMSAHYEVHVVEFDAIVHRHYKFKGPIKTVLGRGGTCFVPLFDKDVLFKIKPDLIAVFTDGYGGAPERPPRTPVIWVLTAGGKAPVKWGRVIQMHNETEVIDE